MALTYTLQDQAFLKLLLHSAKYPADSINGVLLGTKEADGTVAIVDCIPLLHSGLTLAPSIEVALAQVEVHAKKAGQQIVAYYYSDARLNSTDLHAPGKRIADKLVDRVQHACVLMLNNQKLAKFIKAGDEQPLELFLRTSSKDWKKPDSQAWTVATARPLPDLRSRFAKLFSQSIYLDISDFDDHLDDISKDWLNRQLELKV